MSLKRKHNKLSASMMAAGNTMAIIYFCIGIAGGASWSVSLPAYIALVLAVSLLAASQNFKDSFRSSQDKIAKSRKSTLLLISNIGLSFVALSAPALFFVINFINTSSIRVPVGAIMLIFFVLGGGMMVLSDHKYAMETES